MPLVQQGWFRFLGWGAILVGGLYLLGAGSSADVSIPLYGVWEFKLFFLTVRQLIGGFSSYLAIRGFTGKF